MVWILNPLKPANPPGGGVLLLLPRGSLIWVPLTLFPFLFSVFYYPLDICPSRSIIYLLFPIFFSPVAQFSKPQTNESSRLIYDSFKLYCGLPTTGGAKK